MISNEEKARPLAEWTDQQIREYQEKKKDILKLAISKYGIEAQKTMAIEECSELINALAKERRGRASDEDVVTEIADVMIMCEQLALIYGENAVEREKLYKLMRLAERMGIGPKIK